MEKIFIVDDDAIIAKVYLDMFEMEGYAVESASDGEIAMEKLKTMPPGYGQQAPQGYQQPQGLPGYPPPPAMPPGPPGYSQRPPGQPGFAPALPMPGGQRAFGGGPMAIQAELRQSFLSGTPQRVADLRARLPMLVKGNADPNMMPQLFDLYRRVHAITGSAGMAGFNRVAKLTGALEALLKELFEDVENVNASTLRPTAHAVELLAALLEQAGMLQQVEPSMPPLIMAVDDEVISRRALVSALELANLRAVSVEDPPSPSAWPWSIRST